MVKIGVLLILSVNAIDEEKTIPPFLPLRRLNMLTRFSREWCRENLTAKQAENWVAKFKRNADRMEIRFEKCGGRNPNPTNRNRRGIDLDSELSILDDDGFMTRYDKTNPAEGINDITNNFKKWAQKYLANCKLQPERQEQRFNKWRKMVKSLLIDDGGSGESELTVTM